ncbi:MAG: hypothetical protein EBZ47_06650 [Chlamydiae bacterium]|nr:hypothetical protein [Chlamydiota bacterium]
MIQEMWQTILQTVKGYSPREKVFLLACMLCSFFISADYALVRPVSNSLFIQNYGAKLFPVAWALSVPLNLAVVYLYNRFIAKLGCFKIYSLVALAIVIGNVCLGIWVKNHPSLSFVFYVWKDVYVMLMFQLLWSVIHSTIELSRARYLYGFLFSIGALGGLSGSLCASKYSLIIGTESLLFFTPAIYGLLTISYYLLIRCSGGVDVKIEASMKKGASLKDSAALIKGSKLLLAILAMVVLMQVTATLTDFQFNTYLEKIYPDKDLRTSYFSRLLAYGNLLTMSFQSIGVYLFIRYLGKFKTHLMIPLILGLNCIAYLFYPVFGMISYSFLTIKCFDFSLFNVIKEMLYIPLKTEEKFRAKALIDVFMYRGAKVLASFFVLLAQLYMAPSMSAMLSWINLGLFCTWVYVVVSIRRFYVDSDALASSPANSF